MQQLYTTLQKEIDGKPISVEPFLLKESDLNVERMMKLMAVDKSEEKTPLYIFYIRKILRNLAKTHTFSYQNFKAELEKADLTPAQRGPLNLRLEMLESFMVESGARSNRKGRRASMLQPVQSYEENAKFRSGVLTIIDLSDPFIDESSACALFDICIGLTLDLSDSCGRVFALDEAHKVSAMSVSDE